MNQPARHSCVGFWRVLLGWVFLAVCLAGTAATANIFSTQFEAGEGYDITADLIGQNGWLGEGSGGNGLVTNFIAGEGQQAFVGFSPPDQGDSELVVWKPINFNPVAAKHPIVTFSVLMSITGWITTTNQWDNFRWSIYNRQTNRLFSLDFDNYSTEITYLLDGTNDFVSTGYYFDNDATYTLRVTMNFASNRWSATLDGTVLVTNKPITTTGAPLNLGDVDAFWLIYDVNNPSDNYMLFDNYKITAKTLPPPPRPNLHWLGQTGDGQALLRLTGQSGTRFVIDATTNLANWTVLKTNVITDGYFDYVDAGAAGLSRRFYRARWVPW